MDDVIEAEPGSVQLVRDEGGDRVGVGDREVAVSDHLFDRLDAVESGTRGVVRGEVINGFCSLMPLRPGVDSGHEIPLKEPCVIEVRLVSRLLGGYVGQLTRVHVDTSSVLTGRW